MARSRPRSAVSTGRARSVHARELWARADRPTQEWLHPGRRRPDAGSWLRHHARERGHVHAYRRMRAKTATSSTTPRP